MGPVPDIHPLFSCRWSLLMLSSGLLLLASLHDSPSQPCTPACLVPPCLHTSMLVSFYPVPSGKAECPVLFVRLLLGALFASPCLWKGSRPGCPARRVSWLSCTPTMGLMTLQLQGPLLACVLSWLCARFCTLHLKEGPSVISSRPASLDTLREAAWP